jgi:hypothetical protein
MRVVAMKNVAAAWLRDVPCDHNALVLRIVVQHFSEEIDSIISSYEHTGQIEAGIVTDFRGWWGAILEVPRFPEFESPKDEGFDQVLC